MKRTLITITILSLFTQFCNAQIGVKPDEYKIDPDTLTLRLKRYARPLKTVDEYKVEFDNLTTRLRLVEKDTNNFIGKPFHDFVKFLEQCDVKTIRAFINYHDRALRPQHVYGIRIWFTTFEDDAFLNRQGMLFPTVVIYFEGSKPYEKALSLMRESIGYYTKEIDEFFSDAVISSFEFVISDDMLRFPSRTNNK